jgi:DNA (cytosine-5)-methyltransferase 1
MQATTSASAIFHLDPQAHDQGLRNMCRMSGWEGGSAGLTVVDLFAGAGGATEGLKRAGYSAIGAVELESDAAATYSRNHPEVLLTQADIRTVSAPVLRRRLGLIPFQLTLLKACPPCQAYSSLGARRPDDPRNTLIADLWRFVREFAPSGFLIENVPGLLNDTRLAHLIRQSRAIGYRVRTHVIDATDFGCPQRRRRLIVIGSRRPLVPPSNLIEALAPEFDRSPRTVADVFNELEGKDIENDPLNRARRLTPSVRERVIHIPEGGNRFDLPDRLRLRCHSSLKNRVATSAYGRMRWDRPAPTLTTRCTTPSCGQFLHPSKDRGITLREAAMLQGFPTSYQFIGGYDSIERQIGNALPVRMAEGLGWIVRRQMCHQ